MKSCKNILTLVFVVSVIALASRANADNMFTPAFGKMVVEQAVPNAVDSAVRTKVSRPRGTKATVTMGDNNAVGVSQKQYDGAMGSGGHYKGALLNGWPDGFGSYTWQDGKKYVGQFKDGRMNGQGTLTVPDKGMYTGQFKNNTMHGHGTQMGSDGKKYVGQFKDGRMNGQGTLALPD
jgi:hypothetical protein